MVKFYNSSALAMLDKKDLTNFSRKLKTPNYIYYIKMEN
jgi:hypothetical protein